MGTSHDAHQDQHLADLDHEVANLRKRINSNVRKIKQLSDQLNARLGKLEPSEHKPVATSPTSSRRKTAGKGHKIR